MFRVIVPKRDEYNETIEEFITFDGAEFQIEHSLVSISKWERKWERPFLSEEPMTEEQSIDYIRCMTITQNVKESAYKYLTPKNREEINQYIDAKMTASDIKVDSDKSKDDEPITAETIYYQMIANQIPIEFQKWHLNSLLALIKLCNKRNLEASGKDTSNKPKMSKAEIAKKFREINLRRRQELNSKG